MAVKITWSYFTVFKKIYYTINNSLQRTDLCKSKRRGFTIVELMIAISVFSVVMIIATTGILLIARQYQSGVTKTAMQSATRDIHQKISDSIKYSGGSIYQIDSGGVTGYSVVCAGNTRYFYRKPIVTENKISTGSEFNSMSSLYFQQQTDDYTPGNSVGKCGYISSVATEDLKIAQQLLPNNAKVAVFDVATTVDDDGITNASTIETTFVRGDYDLFNLPSIPGGLKCKSGVGNEWCSVVSLSSIVNPRL